MVNLSKLKNIPHADQKGFASMCLATWLISLMLAGLLPLVQSDPLLALLMDVIVLLISLVSCALSIICYRRSLGNVWVFTTVAGSLILIGYWMQLPMSVPTYLWTAYRSLNGFFALLELDLLMAVIFIAVIWGWNRNGGWYLAIALPLIYVWTPLIVSMWASPQVVARALLQKESSFGWLNLALGLSFCLTPLAVFLVAIDLLRSFIREYRVSPTDADIRLKSAVE